MKRSRERQPVFCARLKSEATGTLAFVHAPSVRRAGVCVLVSRFDKRTVGAASTIRFYKQRKKYEGAHAKREQVCKNRVRFTLARLSRTNSNGTLCSNGDITQPCSSVARNPLLVFARGTHEVRGVPWTSPTQIFSTQFFLRQ